MIENTPATFADLSARQFRVVRHSKHGAKIVWEAHVRAAYAAQYFVHEMGSRRQLMLQINQACEGDSLPLAEPDYQVFEIPPEMTDLHGSVVTLRATWPSENELAL